MKNGLRIAWSMLVDLVTIGSTGLVVGYGIGWVIGRIIY